MGLHRECSLGSLPAFEREMRRQLWWQIASMGSRAGGSTVMLNRRGFLGHRAPPKPEGQRPNPANAGTPRDRPSAAEMLFCEIRFEIGDCMRKLTAMEHQLVGASILERMVEERAINALESRLEDGYLNDCNPSIPFHQLALYLARSSIC